uniref:Uncharacterized protein n=1 Tax=Heliothis virescens TaxID=7102 RepID=A0A2A4JGM4_HELVI
MRTNINPTTPWAPLYPLASALPKIRAAQNQNHNITGSLINTKNQTNLDRQTTILIYYFKYGAATTMNAVHVTFCNVVDDAPHPCDDPPPCDPFKQVEGACPGPYICYERIKNPAFGNTKCLEGPFINATGCGRRGKPRKHKHHPCDPLPPCSKKPKRRECQQPTLCYHRIKNPEWPKKAITSDCNPDL